MRNYRVSIHVDLLEVIPARGKAREQIMEFVKSLSHSPSLEGDYSEKDDTERSLEVSVVGDYAIVFWADIPANMVMVVDIRRADH
ncbi:MAG: hypothetical protein AB8F34_09270 [Akkermansiaceae bacterium]